MPPFTRAASRHSLSPSASASAPRSPINRGQGASPQAIATTCSLRSTAPGFSAAPVPPAKIVMARPKQAAKRYSRPPCNPALLFWGLATLTSVSLNLVTLPAYLPVYKDALAALRDPKPTPTPTPTPNTCLVEPMASSQQQIGASRVLSKDSVINLEQGDPTMFESFWQQVGDRAQIVISGWQTMSYFSDARNMCWFMEPEFDAEIRRLHRLVGNAVEEDRHIIVGTGSTQLFQAALYALSSPNASEPMSVVSAVPYYSSYPAVTDFLKSGLFRWAGDANAFTGDEYIELVCSPNNPDGFIREAVLKSDSGKTIHDLAYYWPQYTPITSPADHEIMLFTVSKATGHAGTRLGWAVVKDRDVAQRMVKFIELNTIGVSKDSQLRAAKILKVLSDGYELPDMGDVDRLFVYGRCLMARRWERLREVVRKTDIFSLPETSSGICNFTGERTSTYPAFAWLKCKKDGIENCEAFLRGHKIITRSGVHFGEDATYVRISMLDRDETFDLLIERLSSIE